MSRLISLEMESFQPHKRRLIEFDRHVTVLVGANGSGKSAAIRAIRWVAFNRPLGDSVIRWKAKSARVVLRTEDIKVIREKGDEGNHYRVNRARYEAFGTSVPDVVTKNLKLMEINFQRQIDAGFWFVHSAPEAAREMNRVVDLDVIDSSQSYTAGKVKHFRGEEKILQGLLEESQMEKARLNWVPRAERTLQDAERIAQACDTALRRLEGIQNLLEDIQEARKASCAIPDTTKIEASINELQVAQERLDGLQRSLSRLKSERKGLKQCRTEIEALEVEVEKTRPETCPTCGSVIQSDRS